MRNGHKEVIIVRHLRSCHNVEVADGLDTVGADSDITEFGHRCGPLLGRFLVEELGINNGTCICTSPFLRCLRTTEYIREATVNGVGIGARPVVEPLSHEYLGHSFGEATIPNRCEEFPDFEWHEIPPEGLDFRKEQNEWFMLRIRKLYASLPWRSVVVTHGLPAFALMHVAADPGFNHMPLWDWCLDNGSVTWVKDGRIIFRGMNLYWEEGSYPRGSRREKYDPHYVLGDPRNSSFRKAGSNALDRVC